MLFKTLKGKTPITRGIFGRIYKNREYLYINGVLIDEQFNVIEENCSLTRAAKLITEYPAINGRTWFKRISLEDLDDQAIQKLKEMGLLETLEE